MGKVGKESRELWPRPKWEIRLERDECPYIAEMAKEGRISRYVYSIAAGMKEEECWNHGVMWPSRTEAGAMAVHPVVGPLLERAWLAAHRETLVLGLRNAAENGNRDAASALADWMARGSIRQSMEDIALPTAGFKIAKEDF